MKKKHFLRTVLPQAAKLPRASGLFKKKMRKSSAPGSAVARDKWLVQEKVIVLEKNSAPGSEAARDKWLVQQKVSF